MKKQQPNGVELRRQRDLRAHEQVIENARQSFLDMGRALMAIRDDRLYLGDFDTFDDYALERWEVTSRQAYRLITAHQVNLILRPIGHKITSEAAARELVPIADDEDMVRAVYEEAARRAAGGRVTAALVKAARDALAPTVIDGEWSDDDPQDRDNRRTAAHADLDEKPADPVAAVPAAQAAVDAFLANQSTPAVPPSTPDAAEETDRAGAERLEEDRPTDTSGETEDSHSSGPSSDTGHSADDEAADPEGEDLPSDGPAEQQQEPEGAPVPAAATPNDDKAKRSAALAKWALDTPEGRAQAKRALVNEWVAASWKLLDEVGPDVFVAIADAGMHEDMDRVLEAVSGWATAKKANSGIRLVKGA